MAQILKQSTEIKVRIGPFVDATDGVTPETGITLGTADQAEALKADGAATVDISGATWAAVTGADGWYDLTLTTSHTDTIGELVVVVQDSSVSLPVFARFQVVEEAVYDDLFAASGAGYLKPTTSGRTLDVTATGAAGIDWGNVENPTTAVDLSATDIQLCDTITTYTGNTVQTGDSFARLGAPAGASVSADIADVPTVAEFNARTLVAASYFDPAADTVANVTTVGTCTTNTDMRGTDSAALATALATAQLDLDTLTGTDGVTLATTQGNYAPAKAADVTGLLTTQMTEDYNTDGTAPTLAQSLFVIMHTLTEITYAGTTATVKKLDGATTAFTLTLDDASSPTSITRAT